MKLGGLFALLFAAPLAMVACRDVARFSTAGDHFEGSLVKGDFVRAGIANDVRLCLTLDTNHLQDAPGSLTASDGRFRSSQLRPIPQIWHDPLSTFSFGEGRTQNLIYVTTPNADASDTGDVFVFVSLMDAGNVEVRLLRGAPAVVVDGSSAGAGISATLFAVFSLDRVEGACAL